MGVCESIRRSWLPDFVRRSEVLHTVLAVFARQIGLAVRGLLPFPSSTGAEAKARGLRRPRELINNTPRDASVDALSYLQYTDLDISFPLDNCYILVTDIVDSTRLYDENPRWMKAQTDLHDQIARRLVRVFNGHVVGNEGDSFHLAFQNIYDAINFGNNFKDQLDELGVELSVRVGINRGQMHIRNCCGYKLYGEPVTELIKFFSHSRGEKLCVKKSLLLNNNITHVKSFCLH
ncbi:hypothetical protein PAPHI01_1775 [Pancytospora philotis]|nr:hypothetical protein PAPHI01_1775 [Pancytospora philotis]